MGMLSKVEEVLMMNCKVSVIYSAGDLVIYMGDFNGHIGRHNNGFMGIMEGILSQNFYRKMLLAFCLENESCVKYIF